MQFVKHFSHAGGNRREKGVGSAIFGDGKLVIRLPNTKDIVECGFIEEGFGVVTKTCTGRKSAYTVIQTKIDLNDLPVELTGKCYKFRIIAEQVSEDEFVFPFKKATMLNKK